MGYSSLTKCSSQTFLWFFSFSRFYFKDYYFENFSLSEIAENNGISRNAIHKQIKSAEQKLEEYEEKLNMIKRDQKIKKILNEIKDERVSKILEIMW